jgi:protein-tyrosine phosphatase
MAYLTFIDSIASSPYRQREYIKLNSYHVNRDFVFVIPFSLTYTQGMYKILFVCTGNICRSPTAEGVLRHHLAASSLKGKVQVDSAGTHGYHIGEPPDRRSIAAAKRRGIMIDDLRARKVTAEDFHAFDLILACDKEHMSHLKRMQPKEARAVTGLFLEYAGIRDTKEVPDPYYGETSDFDHVLDLTEQAVAPLIDKLQRDL